VTNVSPQVLSSVHPQKHLSFVATPKSHSFLTA